MKTNIIKRFNAFAMALVLSLSALMVWVPSQALAATRTWDGGGSDNKWSTAENWSGDTAPVNGDVVVFDLTDLAESQTLENDIENLSLAGINRTGSATNHVSYTITGNGITLTGPIKGSETSLPGYLLFDIEVALGSDIEISEAAHGVSMELNGKFSLGTYSLTLNLSSVNEFFNIRNISGSGNIIVNGGTLNLLGTPDNYTGDVLINNGVLATTSDSIGPNATIAITGKSSLEIGGGSVKSPITIGGTGIGGSSINAYRAMGGSQTPLLFEGGFTLTSDISISSSIPVEIKNPFTSNGHTIVLTNSSNGTLKLPGQAIVEPKKETVTIKADDSQPDKFESVSRNKTYVIDGKRGIVNVSAGGVLKGKGEILSLFASSEARVAPGHSPGSLTVLSSLDMKEDSIFEVEIKSADEYDQLVVGENYVGQGSAAVTLINATLEGIILEGFNIKSGDTFTIIDNKSDTEVVGTFKDLPEGATFKISDGVFKITYVGGDGNDVVLSVVTVPTAPNSGFRLVLASPAVLLAATIASAGAAYYLVRRYSLRKAAR